MLSDLLGRLQKILVNYDINFSEQQIKNLAETLKYYNKSILHPRVLKREMNLSYNQVNDLMIFLETQGILRSKFKTICTEEHSNKVEKIYNSIKEVPLTVCDRCEKECSMLTNVIVVFEVDLNDE